MSEGLAGIHVRFKSCMYFIGMMNTTLYLVSKIESYGQQRVQWQESKHGLVSTFS